MREMYQGTLGSALAVPLARLLVVPCGSGMRRIEFVSLNLFRRKKLVIWGLKIITDDLSDAAEIELPTLTTEQFNRYEDRAAWAQAVVEAIRQSVVSDLARKARKLNECC